MTLLRRIVNIVAICELRSWCNYLISQAQPVGTGHALLVGTMTTTQREIDKAIRYFMSWAEFYEEKRDACLEFSPEYWENHDKMTNMDAAAEALMPGCMSRSPWWS